MTTDGGAPRQSVDGARAASRFQEGSMNDRTSAAPPVQFLGPEEAAEFERQFYNSSSNNNVKNGSQRFSRRTRSVSRRRERPQSSQGPLQSLPYSTLQLQDEQAKQTQEEEEQMGQAHKRPGFLGRVREAIFGKSNPLKPVLSNVQNEIDKRTSLQQPPTRYTDTQPQARPMPIPVQGGMVKSMSEQHIPQLPASFHASGSNLNDRPSRDEVMASYNQLMATGFFKAHAIQSTRQPAPGTSVPTTRRAAVPSLPTIPSPQRPSLDQLPKRPSFQLTPPSPPKDDDRQLPVPSMPSSLPPPPPLFPQIHQVKPKPSWESFRKGLRGRKRGRAEGSDDNASESASMVSQHLPSSSSTTIHIATQVGGIGRRVSKKLRKMPSALANQLQSRSDGMIRVVPGSADGPPDARNVEEQQQQRAVRMRSPSPAASNFKAGGGRGAMTGSRPGSSSGRLHKRGKGSSSKPPIALDNYPHLDPSRMTQAQQNDFQTTDWEPMNIDDGAHSNRGSVDISMKTEHEIENVGHLLRDGQLGIPNEPLSVVPDLNRGIPSVPQIPRHFKRSQMDLDENSTVGRRVGEAF